MNSHKRSQVILLIIGDLILFYLSLYTALSLRYLAPVEKEIWSLHQLPFFYIHTIWLVVFYIGGLYETKNFSSFKKIVGAAIKTMVAASIAAISVFYLIPEFLIITPKINLVFDILILAILLVLWRRTFWSLSGKTAKTKTLFFGASPETEELVKNLKNNPLIGYEPTIVLTSVNSDLIELIKNHSIQLIVASKTMMQDKKAAKKFYETLPLGVSIIDFESFYETLVEKIPTSLITETWFLENVLEINKKGFEIAKRIFDILGAIFLGAAVLIATPIIAMAIKTESHGSIFYKQKRVGKNGKIFEVVKFRSMIDDAEKQITGWAKPEKTDARVTRVGKILRKSRIDELPQIWNILKGEMSFVGPRPERPEFVEKLEQEIPFYSMRHIVKPGATGWSQIKLTDASAKDAMEKLQYDLYYLKNRSLVLDLAIAAKTVAIVLGQKGK